MIKFDTVFKNVYIYLLKKNCNFLLLNLRRVTVFISRLNVCLHFPFDNQYFSAYFRVFQNEIKGIKISTIFSFISNLESFLVDSPFHDFCYQSYSLVHIYSFFRFGSIIWNYKLLELFLMISQFTDFSSQSCSVICLFSFLFFMLLSFKFVLCNECFTSFKYLVVISNAFFL